MCVCRVEKCSFAASSVFDPENRTVLNADASGDGLGAVMT